MKNIKYFIIVAVISTMISTLYASGKRYHVKSGEVRYEINSGGSFLGMGSKTKGTSELLFKDWGNIEITKENSTTTGMGSTDSINKLVKIDNGKVYDVDFDNQVIVTLSPAVLQQSKDKDMSKMGKDMLVSMGGKQVGNEDILGYNCEIWELMGSRVWLYKGVTLKVESSLMGFKSSQIATYAKFNTNLPNSKFKLPNYPIKTMNQMINSNMNTETKTKTKSNEQDAQMPQEVEQIKGLIKNLGGLFGK